MYQYFWNPLNMSTRQLSCLARSPTMLKGAIKASPPAPLDPCRLAEKKKLGCMMASFIL